ncbi:MAG: hypothetical protein WBP00_10820 [Saprospiraceae bacterium]
MNTYTKIVQMLTNGSPPVYLLDSFEGAVFHLYQEGDETKATAKFKGGEEYSIDSTTKLVYEAMLGGELITEKEYKEY